MKKRRFCVNVNQTATQQLKKHTLFNPVVLICYQKKKIKKAKLLFLVSYNDGVHIR